MANTQRSKSSIYRDSMLAAAIATCLCVIPSAGQAEIYRYVDEQGKVHYTDQAPENRNVENLKSDIEEAVKRNTLPSLDTQRKNDPEWVKSLREEREKDAQEQLTDKARHDQAIKDWKRAVKDAKARLKKARAEQKAGKDAMEGDFIGKVGGGARPSEQYHQRQIDLAARVKAAQESLDQLKMNKPKQAE